VEGREGRSSTVAARMARWRGGAGARRRRAPFIGRANDRRLRRDDEGRDAAVLRRSSAGARTAGPRTDRRSVACVAHVRHGDGEARGAGQSRRLESGDSLGKARDLGRRPASPSVASGANAERARARGCGVAARRHGVGRGPTRICVADPCLSKNKSQFLNRSVPTDEYEICRSSYPLPLSKRLYSVFLNRFCRKGLPTLNATQLP
jgi:hypothetical protein